MRVAAATVLALLALAAPARARTETAALGAIRAELSYVQKADFEADHITMRVFAGDTQIAGRALADTSSLWPAGMNAGTKSVKVVDVDGDGVGEALFDLYTGGAHCCLVTYLYAGAAEIKRNWGDPGYRLVDLDDDGVPEFRSGDAAFAYRFSSYAASLFPAQILRLAGGALEDVTREDRFKPTVSTEATGFKRIYRRYKRKLRGDAGYREAVRSSLAAYTADQCTLGQCRTGYQLVRRAVRRHYVGRSFQRRLGRFLTRRGYDA